MAELRASYVSRLGHYASRRTPSAHTNGSTYLGRPTLEMGGRGAACLGRTGYRMGFCGPGRLLDVQQRYAPAYYNPMMGIIHTSVVYCVW